MEEEINTIKDNKNLYTFQSAQKLYLAQTNSSYILMEKKEKNTNPKVLSLAARGAVVISKDGGMLLYPRSK